MNGNGYENSEYDDNFYVSETLHTDSLKAYTANTDVILLDSADTVGLRVLHGGQLKVSDAYTLPTSVGTANYVLHSDGTDAQWTDLGSAALPDPILLSTGVTTSGAIRPTYSFSGNTEMGMLKMGSEILGLNAGHATATTPELKIAYDVSTLTSALSVTDTTVNSIRTTGGVSVSGNISIGGNISKATDLNMDIGGSTRLTVGNPSTFYYPLNVTSTLTCGGEIQAGSNAITTTGQVNTGTLVATGAVSCTNITSSGVIDVGTGLSLGGDWGVNGQAIFGDVNSLTINASVTGALTHNMGNVYNNAGASYVQKRTGGATNAYEEKIVTNTVCTSNLGSVMTGWDWKLNGTEVAALDTNGLDVTGLINGVTIGTGGTNSIEIGLRASSGAQSEGICIGTDSAASTASDGIAIGRAAVVVGQYSIAIGAGADNTAGNNCISIGNDTVTSAVDCVAIGDGAQATHATSVAIGKGATTAAINQIVLGTSSETVVIPSSAATLNGNSQTFPASAGTLLNTASTTSALTTVGALNSGSITSGFGAIDIGSSTLNSGVITSTSNIQSGGYILTPLNRSGNITAGGSASIPSYQIKGDTGQGLYYDIADSTACLSTASTRRIGVGASGIVVGNGATKYTLPLTDGTANQHLITNGSGAVSWGEAGGGGSGSFSTITATDATDASTTTSGALQVAGGISCQKNLRTGEGLFSSEKGYGFMGFSGVGTPSQITCAASNAYSKVQSFDTFKSSTFMGAATAQFVLQGDPGDTAIPGGVWLINWNASLLQGNGNIWKFSIKYNGILQPETEKRVTVKTTDIVTVGGSWIVEASGGTHTFELHFANVSNTGTITLDVEDITMTAIRVL